jgi:O-antigen/teichoic acid export membrane protein
VTFHRVPKGPAKIALGSGVLAASQLAVVAIAGRTTTVEQLGLYLTWFMAASLAGLLFTVLESLVPQSLLTQPTESERKRALARWSQGTVVSLIPVTLVIILADAFAPSILDGNWSLLLCMLAYTGLSAGQSLIRGQATAEQDFGTFLTLMTSDGVVRVISALAVGIMAPSASWFAVATCAGAAVGLIAGWARTRSAWGLRRSELPVTSTRALVQTGWSTASATILNNGIVPWMAALGTVSAAAIASFSTAQTLSRAPMLAIAAVYAPLVAPLAHLARERAWAEYRTLLVRAMSIAALVGFIFTGLLAIAGNELINVFLGAEVSDTPKYVFGLLGLSTLGLLVAAPPQAALAARGKWASIAWSWTGAMVVLVLCLNTSVNPASRGALAAAASAIVVALLNGRASFHRTGARLDSSSGSKKAP